MIFYLLYFFYFNFIQKSYYRIILQIFKKFYIYQKILLFLFSIYFYVKYKFPTIITVYNDMSIL